MNSNKKQQIASAIKFLGFIVFIYIFSVSIISQIPEKTVQESKQEKNTLDIVLESTPTKEQPNERKYYKVTKVVDGDTLDISIEGKVERIRLIGLNTPETVDPRRPVQCYGIEASNKAKEILLNQEVAIESDVTQGDADKYGRLLRYVFLKDGTNFTKKMLEEGYGHEYTYDQEYKYQKEFKEAEKYARDNEVGLWSTKTCLVPNQNTK